MPPAYTVIIPAFNEEASIGAVLDDVAAHLPADTEVLVVDGGSDGTRSVVESRRAALPHMRYIAHPDDRGKGHAIRTGMQQAKGRLQAQFDSDGQFFAKDLPRLFALLEAGGADVVLGSRFLHGSGQDSEASLVRDFGNFFISAWFSLLFRRRITDSLAGIKAWRKEAVPLLDLRSDGFEYEAEIPARALRHRLGLTEVPVSTRARQAGATKVSVFKVGLRIVCRLLVFRFEPLAR